MTSAEALDPDPGLFGPDSISWHVHADPSFAIAGLRALMLQALHPVAMAGVAQHSDFRRDFWGRLFRTAEYVAVTTYGTTAQAYQAAAHVRGIHRRLQGTDPETSRSYRTDDPDLLLWVHCGLVESFLSTALRCGLRLSPEEQDVYCGEQTLSAGLVGLDPDDVPASREELDAYFRRLRPVLRATPDAYRGAAFLLWPPMPALVQVGTPARPAWAALATAAFAMLPRWARRLYHLPGLPTTDWAATATGAALRSGVLAIPEPLRRGPHLAAARQRLGLA